MKLVLQLYWTLATRRAVHRSCTIHQSQQCTQEIPLLWLTKTQTASPCLQPFDSVVLGFAGAPGLEE